MTAGLRWAQHRCRVSRTLTIRTDCDPETNPYIASVEVNGQKTGRLFLTWEEITDGGEILFRLRERADGN